MELGDGTQLVDHLDRLAVDMRDWNSLPLEMQDLILAFLPLQALFRVRVVCKDFFNVVNRRAFHHSRARLRPRECSLSPLVFYAEKESWHVRGFDSETRVWRRLPPFQKPIPPPAPYLFKDFHVSADKGLFCVNVGGDNLYVTNPLMGEVVRLPALKLSRRPVIITVHVTLAKKTNSFQVIAVGSAAVGSASLSKKTDVYDSVKGHWEAAGDVPGVEFSLNDYQTGVWCEELKLLLCVGFMVDGSKGILAFDVEKRKWREDGICPLPDISVRFAIAQLLKCNGRVYLFSEQEAGRNVTHCIHRLDLYREGYGFTWNRVVKQERHGNRALLVYPEYTCTPVGDEDKVCIFNTIDKSGMVYDLRTPEVPPQALPPPEVENGVVFHSLNPVAYAFEPSFGVAARCSEDDTPPTATEGDPAHHANIPPTAAVPADSSKLCGHAA